MDSTSGWESAFRVMMGGSWLVSLLCQAAIIVVIATVVRRHRPDAWTALLAWAIAGAAVWFISPALSFVTTRWAIDSAGVAGVYKSQVLNQLVGIPLHIVVIALLIRGLVKLAQPPKPVDLPPAPPYR